MVPSWVNVFNVDSVEQNFAFSWIVEPLNHRDDGGLATARRAAQCNNPVLLVVNRQVDALQYLHICFRRVMELNASQLNFALDLFVFHGHSSFSVDLGSMLEDLNDLVRGTDDLSCVTKHIRQDPKVE